MADLMMGKVNFNSDFAGYLKEEPGDRFSFTYDASYLAAKKPIISISLPLQPESHTSDYGLHSFFDNLVAEGWLAEAQGKILNKKNPTRFELLLAFGFDCAGAVSIFDPDPVNLHNTMLDLSDPKELAVFQSRASISGVQAKLAVIKTATGFRGVQAGETSTHIAKFEPKNQSSNHSGIIINECLTSIAFKKLLPNDKIAELSIGKIEGNDANALIIKRFDREGGSKIHFEEFNQLLNMKSQNKYNGSHKMMSDFIYENSFCQDIDAYNLFNRIIAGILLGNTDMHLKNFAMMHTSQGLRLTPTYDQVGGLLFGYKEIALKINNAELLPLTKLKYKHIISLGEEMGINKPAIKMAIKNFEKHLSRAIQAVKDSKLDAEIMKNKITTNMEKTWNRTFALIGQHL